MNTEGGKILNDADPNIIALKVIQQLQDRVSLGERFTGISAEAWEAIPDKISFKALKHLLSMVISESMGSTHTVTLGPSHGAPERLHGCVLTFETARGDKEIVRAVLAIPDTPIMIVYRETQYSFHGLRDAGHRHIRKAGPILTKFKNHNRAGAPRNPVYDAAAALIKADPSSYDQVIEDVQNEDPNINTENIDSAMDYRGVGKRGN